MLIPFELPAVYQSFLYTSKSEVRELIAYDQRLLSPIASPEFMTASQAVGHTHLLHLRSLKDQRVARRYLDAVEKGEAHGWHTLVYGLVLSLYSLPLRQGLAAFCRQTVQGFIRSAPACFQLDQAEEDSLLDESRAKVLPAIEALVGQWR